MPSPDEHRNILVINCGSSSIKYQLYRMPERRVLARGLIERIGESRSALEHHHADRVQRRQCPIPNHEQGVTLMLEALTGADAALRDVREIDAVGHRVVHGGAEFTGSMLIDDTVIATLERFVDLAPLHNPPNLIGIRATTARLPGVPQVGCFDTAFHATIPEVAYTYALPYDLCRQMGIRRYGFHGTSHRFVARRAAELLGKDKYDFNGITAHLGNGCSITAIRAGRSVDTSMGLTPLEGLVMGTRTGDVDPAILFYLGERGYDIATLKTLCNTQSGLLGISGLSNDVRTLTELAEAGNTRARLALDIFCYRLRKYIGMYSAVLDRVDAIVFTGGIGENAAGVRAEACRDLQHLGIQLDPAANARVVGRREGPVTVPDSRVQVLVIPTDEEAAIAHDTYNIACRERSRPPAPSCRECPDVPSPA